MKHSFCMASLVFCLACLLGGNVGAQVPDNATAFGGRFACNVGYVQTGNSCQKPSDPNATAFGGRFACNAGYKISGSSCAEMTESEKIAQRAAIASSRYNYNISGYGDAGYITGSIDASNGSKDVSGYLYLENGEEVYFYGEFTGNGIVEGYDDNGNYYWDLEVE
jgi:hypothetical protein